MTRLPPPEERIRPRKGQIWRCKKNGLHIIITGGKGGNYCRTAMLENPKVQHKISVKDIWIFYEYITHNGKATL